MLVNKTYKFRIYPNKKQEIVIAKMVGPIALYVTI
nr:helix-turn-helix domain-containing protein [Bacillus cereus]